LNKKAEPALKKEKKKNTKQLPRSRPWPVQYSTAQWMQEKRNEKKAKQSENVAK
jgi:hypothetical protein